MYLLINGIQVNTSHIVSIEQPDEAGVKSIVVALSNGASLRVAKEDAKGVYDAVTSAKITGPEFEQVLNEFNGVTFAQPAKTAKADVDQCYAKAANAVEDVAIEILGPNPNAPIATKTAKAGKRK